MIDFEPHPKAPDEWTLHGSKVAPWTPDPTAFTVQAVENGKGGRKLLTIFPDGRVEGEIDDASEAGRIFVESVRSAIEPMLGRIRSTPPLPTEIAGSQRVIEAVAMRRAELDGRDWRDLLQGQRNEYREQAKQLLGVPPCFEPLS